MARSQRFLWMLGAALALPVAALAQSTGQTQNLASLISLVIGYFSGILALLMGLAVVIFVYYILHYFLQPADNRAEAWQYVLWSLVGFFVIFSMWGLVGVLISTFNLQSNPTSWSQIQNIFPMAGGTAGSGSNSIFNAGATPQYGQTIPNYGVGGTNLQSASFGNSSNLGNYGSAVSNQSDANVQQCVSTGISAQSCLQQYGSSNNQSTYQQCLAAGQDPGWCSGYIQNGSGANTPSQTNSSSASVQPTADQYIKLCMTNGGNSAATCVSQYGNSSNPTPYQQCLTGGGTASSCAGQITTASQTNSSSASVQPTADQYINLCMTNGGNSAASCISQYGNPNNPTPYQQCLTGGGTASSCAGQISTANSSQDNGQGMQTPDSLDSQYPASPTIGQPNSFYNDLATPAQQQLLQTNGCVDADGNTVSNSGRCKGLSDPNTYNLTPYQDCMTSGGDADSCAGQSNELTQPTNTSSSGCANYDYDQGVCLDQNNASNGSNVTSQPNPQVPDSYTTQPAEPAQASPSCTDQYDDEGNFIGCY